MAGLRTKINYWFFESEKRCYLGSKWPLISWSQGATVIHSEKGNGWKTRFLSEYVLKFIPLSSVSGPNLRPTQPSIQNITTDVTSAKLGGVHSWTFTLFFCRVYKCIMLYFHYSIRQYFYVRCCLIRQWLHLHCVLLI